MSGYEPWSMDDQTAIYADVRRAHDIVQDHDQPQDERLIKLAVILERLHRRTMLTYIATPEMFATSEERPDVARQ